MSSRVVGAVSYRRLMECGMSQTLEAMQRDLDSIARGVLPEQEKQRIAEDAADELRRRREVKVEYKRNKLTEKS